MMWFAVTPEQQSDLFMAIDELIVKQKCQERLWEAGISNLDMYQKGKEKPCSSKWNDTSYSTCEVKVTLASPTL